MFHYKNLKISCPEQVYFPREDSILMAEVLEKVISTNKVSYKQTIEVLEIGCGSGFLSILAASLGTQVTAVDINPVAVDTTKQNAKTNNIKLTSLVSDLFSKVTKKFDLIIFNPPYLPNEDSKLKGSETWADSGQIKKFIQQVSNHLNPSGTVLLLISSLTQTPVEQLLQQNNLSFKTIAKKKLPWEELEVLSANKTQ
jgi:release factor glutamine methyltransferase